MNRRHGACERDVRLYGTWKTMMHRCYDPKRERYKDYGGRGITVCNEWHDPNSFINWSYTHGYQDGLQIDRVDNDRGYSPDNCRWVTAKENSRNRRNTVRLTINGETKSVAEWTETIDISPFTIYWWVRTKGEEYAEGRIAAWNRRAGEDGN